MYTYNTLYTGYKLQVTTKQHLKVKNNTKKIKRTHIFMIIFLLFLYFIIIMSRYARASTFFILLSFIMLEPGLGVVPV